MSRDRDALLDIVETIRLIREHGPRDEQEPRDDVVRQAATLRWIEVIGEAANRVSDGVRARHPEVPWSAVIGMRHVVAHGYDRIRLDVVWRVLDTELAALEAHARTILEELA